MRRAIDWTMAIVAVASLGLLTGWMVGASRTPVTAAVLPLLFGLIGVVFVQAREQRAKVKQLIDAIGVLDEELKTVALDILRRSTFAFRQLAAIWAICVIVFAGSLYLGVRSGASRHELDYPSITELTKGQFPRNRLSSQRELVMLNSLRSYLISKNIHPDDVVAIFRDCITERSTDECIAVERMGDPGSSRALRSGDEPEIGLVQLVFDLIGGRAPSADRIKFVVFPPPAPIIDGSA